MKKIIKTLLIFAFIMPVVLLFAGCAKTYQIDYMVDGELYKTVYVKSDEPIFRQPGPNQTGYIFDGWYLSETGEEKFDFSKYLDGNIRLYARYNKASYAVIYHNMDGAQNNPNNRTSFDITTPTFQLYTEGVTKTGYAFDGWYADPLYVIDKTHINQGTHEDVHLYARWIANDYTINFESNGGTAVASITGAYGSAVSAPEAPTREGYTFAGWYTDNNTFEHQYNFTTIPLEGITLYAKWTINQHTMRFNSNGGTEVANITQEYGTAVTAPTTTKTGYTFVGWFINQTTQYTFTTMPDQDIDLVAHWTPIEYTITFNSAEGSAVADVTYTIETSTFELPTPTREGYTFGGWYVDETKYTQIAQGSTGSLSLVAHWTINTYTLTFIYDNGDDPAEVEYNYNASIALPSNPTREGYRFVAWTPAIPVHMPSHDVTVTATWIAEYAIDYHLDGVTEINHANNPATYTAEEAFTFGDPTKVVNGLAYTFLGWFDNADFEGEAVTGITAGTTGALNLYAKWELRVDNETDLRNAIGIENAQIYVYDDILLDQEALVIEENITLYLGDYTIVGADAVNGAAIEVNAGAVLNIYADNGGVTGGSYADCKAIRSYGTVNIYGGTYFVGADADGNGNGCVEAWGNGVVNIYDGFFATEADYNGFYYVLNQKNNATNSEINVYAGTFLNYDPSTGDDVLHGNFVANSSAIDSYYMEDDHGNMITIYMVFSQDQIAIVSTEADLKAAIASEDILYIKPGADIVLTERLDVSGRKFINGQNHKLSGEFAEDYAVYVTAGEEDEPHEVVFKALTIEGDSTAVNGALYASRGFGLESYARVEMIGVNITGYRYALYSNDDGVDLIAIQSNFTGYAAIYVRGTGYSENEYSGFMFVYCTLNGVNTYNSGDNNFGAIVFNRTAKWNVVNLTESVVTATTTGTASEAVLLWMYESEYNNVRVYSSNPANAFVLDGANAYLFCNNAAQNGVFYINNTAQNISNNAVIGDVAVDFERAISGVEHYYVGAGDAISLTADVELSNDVVVYATTGTITINLDGHSIDYGELLIANGLTVISDAEDLPISAAQNGYHINITNNGDGTYTYTVVAD